MTAVKGLGAGASFCRAILAIAALLAGGCKGEAAGKSSEDRRPWVESVPPRPSVRTRLAPFASLVHDAARAELEVEGLLIEFGSADQLKYTRGGWRNGWGMRKLDGSIGYGEARAKAVPLELDLRQRAVRHVMLRARSEIPDQRVSVLVDGKPIGNASIGPSWATARIPVKEGAMGPGRRELKLWFAKGRDDQVRADIDWLYFASDKESREPVVIPRLMPMKVGEFPKRALVAPTPRRYSFYLQVPDRASLIVDLGASSAATFSVRAQSNDGAIHKLFEEEVTGPWREQQVSLHSLAGQAIRLELATRGGAAGWGEPEIMVEPGAQGASRPTGATPRPRNVVFVLIDTARADTFGPFAPGNKVKTPAFDELAKRATVFVNAYNNENWTKPSVATLLSGTYPSTHDTKSDDSALPEDVELLSERLKKEGFSTAGFVANGYISKAFGFEQGWDFFRNYIREDRSTGADHVYRDALEWLTEHKDERFFIYIQTIDPHVTYNVDPEYTKLYFEGDYTGPLGSSVTADEQVALSEGKLKASERDLEWLRALYFGEITYHDKHMGHFFAQLRQLGLLETTLVVVTNDHGEELGDHNRFGHGHSLYEELLRAPLLMRYPPLFPPGGTVSEVVEHVDVAPTIIDALGLEPLAQADGSSLLPLLAGEAVHHPTFAVAEFLDQRRAIRVGNWKLMLSSGDWAKLFDVEQDPKEENDRLANSLIARRMCEIYLAEALATPTKRLRQQDVATARRFKSTRVKMSPQLRRQLEALGYFGD